MVPGPVREREDWEETLQLDQLGRDHKMDFDRLPFPSEQFEAIGFTNVSMGRTLGEGGFGSVVEIKAKKTTGEQTEVDVQMACKIIAFPEVKPKNREELIQEVKYMLMDARSLARLDHPNIVKTYGVIEVADRETGFPFSRVLILMEVCDGHLQDLVDRNFKTGMSEEQHKRWFRQIGSALDYMHNRALVAHLDLKPENIMFIYPTGGKYQPLKDSMPLITYKLTDFGTAVGIEGGKQAVRPYTGTEGFRAPEIEDDDAPPVDARKLDVFSLAVIIWEFLTNPDWCSNAKLTEDDLIAALSPQFHDLMSAMRDPDPDQRPTMDQVMQSPWLQQ